MCSNLSENMIRALEMGSVTVQCEKSKRLRNLGHAFIYSTLQCAVSFVGCINNPNMFILFYTIIIYKGTINNKIKTAVND